MAGVSRGYRTDGHETTFFGSPCIRCGAEGNQAPSLTTLLRQINVNHSSLMERIIPGGLNFESPETANDTKGESSRQKTERVEDNENPDPWQTVLEVGKEHDEDLIDNWKDELNNLLIFAGLFSAVVTAFTIESYQWLQEDPADASVALLTQISQQLSSFTVSPGFINSTVTVTRNATTPFNPGTSAVNINVLWSLSLTLSLVSAFYAITVQQWIRQLSIPRYLLPRDAVRLRQWRYECLMAWQVPSIITFLPLLIQIAVILFLSGLLILLSTLNDIVTQAFAVVAGLCLILFGVTVVCPLLSIRCPYKSPVIPTLLAVLQWLAAPAIGLVVLGVSGIGLFFITIFLLLDPLTLKYLSGQSWQARVIVQPLGLMWELFFSKLLDTIRPSTVGLQRFWTTIETEEVSWQWNVEVPALSWALATTSGDDALPLRQAFQVLSVSQKTHCALLTVANSIGFHTADGSISNNVRELRRFQRLLYRPDRSFESMREDHVDLMVEALSSDWVSTKWASADNNISPLLLLLHLSTHTERVAATRFFRLLIDARSNQDIRITDPLHFLNQRIPTLLLCKQLYRANRIGLTSNDTTQLLKFAERDLYTGQWLSSPNLILTRGATRSTEWILASVASALTALNVHPQVISSDRRNLINLLSEFGTFVAKHRDTLVAMVKYSERKEQEDLLFVTYLAITMICDALEFLAVSRILPLSADCPSVVLVNRIYAIVTRTKKTEYQTACRSLSHFREVIANSEETTPQTQQENVDVAAGVGDHGAFIPGARRSLVPCHASAPMLDDSPPHRIPQALI